MTMMNDEQMEKVSGGGINDRYDDLAYRNAGVDIGQPDMFSNKGYMFKGKKITSEEADALAGYFLKHHEQASSVKQAIKAMQA